MRSRMLVAALLLASPFPAAAQAAPGSSAGGTDTLYLQVGSPEVDGRVFPPHRARNTVYIGDATTPVGSWTNELTVGDSAGIPVMRWVTLGRQGNGGTWELRQTYHAHSLAPLAWYYANSGGAETTLRLTGSRVHGVQRAPDADDVDVDRTLARRGFIASASDLIPMAVGLRAGAVMVAPVWGPSMEEAEDRVFTVVGQETVSVEGVDVTAWKVLEHVRASGALYATWWLTESSPFMVLAEIPMQNGQVRRITGVDLDR